MIGAFAAVAIGGALGALSRFALGLAVLRLWPQAFALPTLLINLLGCLAIGILYGLWLNRPELSPLLLQGLMTGFLGAFTTFSAFSLDAWRLLENGQSQLALGYVLLSVCLCLTATWAGLLLTR
ncbi:MAG: fluoride efflux transporter CrcB [Gammaproteobacteria bacterium]|nr:fluoride efflux transporter CrcB [Gammaproteobacteria bacterium]